MCGAAREGPVWYITFMNLDEKEAKLEKLLQEMAPVVVAAAELLRLTL